MPRPAAAPRRAVAPPGTRAVFKARGITSARPARHVFLIFCCFEGAGAAAYLEATGPQSSGPDEDRTGAKHGPQVKGTTMNRILIASAALVALSGAALAEGTPALEGNYSAAVLNQVNGTTLTGETGFVSAASARNVSGLATAAPSASPLDDTNYSR